MEKKAPARKRRGFLCCKITTMIDEFEKYFSAADEARREGLNNPVFRELLTPLDQLYRRASKIESKGGGIIFRELSLVAHKSLLAASALIAQRQPEDSTGITRRALEAAKTYLAIKVDPVNLKNWIAFKERDTRWRVRREGKKPKGLHVKLRGLRGNPLADRLDLFAGMFSDAALHYTPEFYSTLNWQIHPLPDGSHQRLLQYFIDDVQQIDRYWLSLVAAHLSILEAFDFCIDADLSKDCQAKQLWDSVRTAAHLQSRMYTRKYSPLYLDAWLRTI